MWDDQVSFWVCCSTRLDLFVEILLECGEFVFAKEATLPPGAEESGAVAGELDERGGHWKQAYPQWTVADGGIDADDEREEE